MTHGGPRVFICPSTGKRSYADRRTAQEMAKGTARLNDRRGIREGIVMHAYQCPECSMWHVGKNWKASQKFGRGDDA